MKTLFPFSCLVMLIKEIQIRRPVPSWRCSICSVRKQGLHAPFVYVKTDATHGHHWSSTSSSSFSMDIHSTKKNGWGERDVELFNWVSVTIMQGQIVKELHGSFTFVWRISTVAMYWLLLWSIKTETPNYLIFTHCRLKMVVDHEFYRIRWLIPLPHFFRVIVRRLIGWHVLPPICVPDSCIINIYEEGTKYLHTNYHIFLCPKTISSSYGREVAKDPANSPTAITFRFWSKNNVTLTKKWCNEEWANEIYGCLCVEVCGPHWWCNCQLCSLEVIHATQSISL